MLFKFVIFVVIVTSLHSNDVELKQAIENTKFELQNSKFEKELLLFRRHIQQLNDIKTFSIKMFDKNDKSRYYFLDKLAAIQDSSKSIIISQFQIYQSLKYINIKDKASFIKYVKPSMEVLYKNHMCDGFLFYGMYLDKVKGNRKSALEVFTHGIDSCKIKWKIFEILSRANQLKYRMGYFKK